MANKSSLLQMVQTRSGADPSGSGANQPPPPPPPPPPNPPTLEQMYIMQTQILHTMQQQLQQQQRQLEQHENQRQGGRQDRQPQAARYEDFLGTQPPLFARADEPLEADAWIRTVESKFEILAAPCPSARKVTFAAQQLRGPALLWWENYRGMLQAGHVVEWDEFKAAFKSHHIPEGLMERTLNEFLNLTQGGRTALQYSQLSNNLCQYADHHADFEAKKIACFRRGLSSKLKERLVNERPATYSAFVSHAIAQEDAILQHKADKKRKSPAVQSSG